ncbi:xylan 1,4-beta-xylosidase [Kribbella sp. VKM Ac-2527]|uniref:Xylan 1,4-beta-xylosidase n=1 Tax=Kribbella caucasensis TaxID=2512215 RepID=A0A4R6J699_9ACTN|nr:glycoside hydrolase family 43 protein [Kribbella sp. VKM Ac-2527]TDO30587.1 xylan 1,4-beta-xylosidase [Kribbella sp. VKM Ac-2527]
MTNTAVSNPILPGFHPDPSIVRVGADYYVANSTFEWFPGIRLHHSRDLVRWTPVGYALTSSESLPLRGVPDSGGVWAPSLSYHAGRYWLVFAVIYTVGGPFKDLDIFLISAPSVTGPWSEPVQLGGGGFDPSLFHDADGRSWLVNMTWDHRPGHSPFAGIVLQELELSTGRLLGRPRTVLTNSELIEGPNLYRRDGWYYLMLAEGGTGWNHGILMARSRSLGGPYELDPRGSLLTSRDNPGLALQKAGHGELVETPTGEWYLAHLASRPVLSRGERRSILGRETCLQQVTWTEDNWLRLTNGTHWPSEQVAVPPPKPETPYAAASTNGRFNGAVLGDEWCSLREPMDDSWVNLTERPGYLRLRGRQSMRSRFALSLVAQRITRTRLTATTSLDYHPQYRGQRAGLVFWYDTTNHYLLGVTGTDDGPRIFLATSIDGTYTEHITDLPATAPVHLRGELRDAHLTFTAAIPTAAIPTAAIPTAATPTAAGLAAPTANPTAPTADPTAPTADPTAPIDNLTWHAVGPTLDAGVLSDDYGTTLRFTGAFVGLVSEDLPTTTLPADFHHFHLT